eukprot:TCONS_00020904-protein
MVRFDHTYGMSIETNKIIELSECNLETKTLLTGSLLKWMDIIACLAAEKCASVPCVTASVDDLQIDKAILLGHVVNLKARVNRIFNTSMEIEVLVISEDFYECSKICQAFFTFVTQPKPNGEKNIVPPNEPKTEEEKSLFALANERKKMRLDYRSSLKRLKDNKEELQSKFVADETSDKNSHVTSDNTYSECVEIVLPQHANHHQTTFGGQLMAWMEQTCSISARRLCHGHPRLLTVDEVFFRAPSKVGDRIVIKSRVNHIFDRCMEVGARVEAYAVGGETRHIQSAFFTFIAPDEKGNPKVLPNMKPMNKDDFYRMKRAEARVKLRSERRMILGNDGLNAVSLNEKNQKILCYKNILELMALYNKDTFKFKLEMAPVRLSQLKIDDSLCIRLETEVDFSAADVYRALSDHTKRIHWDMFITEVEILKEIKKSEDHVLRYKMSNLKPGCNTKGDDIIVLASCRQEKDYAIIAYRSVKLDEFPPVPEYHRAINRCSGFIIEGAKRNEYKTSCKVTYINQLTEHIYEYVKTDLKGATETLSQRAAALVQVIKTDVAGK